MGAAYYNEIDPYAAQWLRNLIAAGHIAPGDVDERSIVDVQPDDLKGYTQAHFFAGIGGWSYAARLAGWPDDRPLWTGSCPCQPFSVAGKGAGASDARHLWPEFFRLIRACRPDVVMGEQVAAAVGKDWLDGVSADLEGIGYSCGAAVVPACAVNAPHRRDRLWFVADRDGLVGGQGDQVARGREGGGRAREIAGLGGACDGAVADAPRGGNAHECFCHGPAGQHVINEHRRGGRDSERHHSARDRSASTGDAGSPWLRSEWLVGTDGKARRVEPGIRLLAHGVPARVGKLRALGNAIVPQVGAEIIAAYMEACS